MTRQHIHLRVNGRSHTVAVEPQAVLLHTLRDLGYTDVKNGCEIGECGACAVLLDGEAVNSCMVLAMQADGADIVTNSGLGTMDKPHVIQESFADAGAIQCGFCTPGMVISTKALLDRNPDPSEAEIRDALSGNLCRCTGYGQIVDAVKLAASRLAGASSQREDARSNSKRGRELDSSNRVLESGDQTKVGGES
ncbi:(2Fe-2S)-binding protein [Candidatus Bipolaricaulota bacterium]|nr:(2Fe-2S)-binding protein [Candidatus Bipolaricaulota bacterium]